MNKKILSIILAASLVAISSCKDDTEEDLLGGNSSNVAGLYINEVVVNNDWIELYNSSDDVIDLSGFILQDNKGASEEYIIATGTEIPAKGFLVFDGENIQFAFGLSSDGDDVTLLDAAGNLIDRVSVPAEKEGNAYARIPDGGGEWKKVTPTKGASNEGGSTPTPNPNPEPEPIPNPIGVDYTKLMVNEVFADGTKDAVDPDWVEIYNSGTVAIDLEGCFVQDVEGKAAAKRVIKAGIIVPAGGYVKIWTELNDAQVAAPTGGFGLSTSASDGVTLFAPDGTKIDRLEYPVPSAAQPSADKSWGRFNGGQGWMTLTPAAANSASTAN